MALVGVELLQDWQGVQAAFSKSWKAVLFG